MAARVKRVIVGLQYGAERLVIEEAAAEVIIVYGRSKVSLWSQGR